MVGNNTNPMAIFWMSGNSGAGKTTLVQHLSKGQDIQVLDGDVVRALTDNQDFSKEGRWQHCLNVAKEAKRLSDHGHTVLVAVIAPYKKLREEIKEICGCTFIYIPGGHEADDEYPYEWPNDVPLTAFRIYVEKTDEDNTKTTT